MVELIKEIYEHAEDMLCLERLDSDRLQRILDLCIEALEEEESNA